MNDIHYILKHNSEKLDFDTINKIFLSLCPLPILKIDNYTYNILSGTQPLDESLLEKIGNDILCFDKDVIIEIYEYLGENKIHNFYKKIQR